MPDTVVVSGAAGLRDSGAGEAAKGSPMNFSEREGLMWPDRTGKITIFTGWAVSPYIALSGPDEEGVRKVKFYRSFSLVKPVSGRFTSHWQQERRKKAVAALLSHLSKPGTEVLFPMTWTVVSTEASVKAIKRNASTLSVVAPFDSEGRVYLRAIKDRAVSAEESYMLLFRPYGAYEYWTGSGRWVIGTVPTEGVSTVDVSLKRSDFDVSSLAPDWKKRYTSYLVRTLNKIK